MKTWLRCNVCMCTLLAVGLLVACDSSDRDSVDTGSEFPPLEDLPIPMPSADNTVLPFFVKPFDGDYPLLNYFDHDRPNAFNDINGYQLTWRGARAFVGLDVFGVDGHEGVDWILPENTPVFSVAAGEVLRVETVEVPGCPIAVQGPDMRIFIEHIAPNGDIYRSWYLHLNRMDVVVGQRVEAGEQIGQSGATGCLGTVPHLHLQIFRATNTNSGRSTPVDPYGWEGPGEDPWAREPEGAESIWLWQAGEAPAQVRWQR